MSLPNTLHAQVVIILYYSIKNLHEIKKLHSLELNLY